MRSELLWSKWQIEKEVAFLFFTLSTQDDIILHLL